MAKKKSKTVTKKQTSAKKKATKKVVDLHAGKRFFRIELSGYGGELIVGKASEEFVKYWSHKNRKELLMDHMQAMNDMVMYGDDDFDDDDEDVERDEVDGFDKDSPEVYEGAGNREYWDFDDIEHETMVSYEHNLYTVTEIKVDPRVEYVDGELSWSEAATKKRNFDWGSKMFEEIDGTSKEYEYDRNVVCRELYLRDKTKGMDDPVPVIMMYDSQKGTFGHVYVMTDGEDFDPNKFAYASLDNTMSNNVDVLYYNKVALTVDHNELSTWGKGFYANVGYVERSDIDFDFKEMLELGWQDLEDLEGNAS
jgi:hypothetical protein